MIAVASWYSLTYIFALMYYFDLEWTYCDNALKNKDKNVLKVI